MWFRAPRTERQDLVAPTALLLGSRDRYVRMRARVVLNGYSVPYRLHGFGDLGGLGCRVSGALRFGNLTGGFGI